MSSLPDHYRSVKLQHGDLVDRIKNATQHDWITVCRALGLHVSPSYGRGSHAVAYKSVSCPAHDSTCLVLTIVHKPHPQIQRDYVKKVVHHGLSSGLYGEADVWKAFGLM